jgi:hypothetical protein
VTGAIHDPCVLDVLRSITAFLEAAWARPWWDFTAAREARLANEKAAKA